MGIFDWLFGSNKEKKKEDIKSVVSNDEIEKSKEQDNFYEYLINKEKTSSEPKDTELELLVKGLKEEEEGFDEDDWLSMKPIISRKNDLITVEYDNLCGTDYIKVENDRYYFDTDYPDDDVPKGDEYPPFRLTQEMEKSIKEEVIPFLKRRYKNLNSKKDYIKMDNEYIIDNVELFERRLDDLLFDEFQNGEKRGRNKKWNLKFSIDEDQLKMELGIEFLYDYDW